MIESNHFSHPIKYFSFFPKVILKLSHLTASKYIFSILHTFLPSLLTLGIVFYQSS